MKKRGVYENFRNQNHTRSESQVLENQGGVADASNVTTFQQLAIKLMT